MIARIRATVSWPRMRRHQARVSGAGVRCGHRLNCQVTTRVVGGQVPAGRIGVSARWHPTSGLRRSISQVVVATLNHGMYKLQSCGCTVRDVDVSVTELRAHLSKWLDRARAGGEVVITDRGIPVARLTAVDSAGTLERLTAEGVIGKATAQRPVAAGRSRPRPRRPVSDRVSDQRR